MNKIKIIDLLNMISKGEEVPKKIKYKDNILYYDDYTTEYPPTFNYYDKDGNNGLIEGWLCLYINDEVEIIEEEQEDKKIEKLTRWFEDDELEDARYNTEVKIVNKINEIIDKINEE